jgi:pimeloyl-ACP methyl ester carboxylesterase
MTSKSERKPIVVFVHGFGSTSKCWDTLLRLLGGDERITSRYELATWDYPTKWVEVNLLGRIPRLQELGRALAAELDSPRYRGRELTLIGHSQGGLVIQSYIADALQHGQAEALQEVRQAIFLATPSEGSMTGISLRRLFSLLFTNPQEVSLRVLNPDVSEIRSLIRERVVGAVKESDGTSRIPIHSFYGLQDDIVVEASARGVFDSVRPMRGNHFSILKPENLADPRYAELVEPLLEPGGHSHRFEVAEYVTELRVEPRAPQEIRTPSTTNPRVVQYDNYAVLKRSVVFAPSNRCKHNYFIQYATRGDGYVVGHPSHPNAASAADTGRGEDSGTYFRF